MPSEEGRARPGRRKDMESYTRSAGIVYGWLKVRDGVEEVVGSAVDAGGPP